jgi:hypothetical protein
MVSCNTISIEALTKIRFVPLFWALDGRLKLATDFANNRLHKPAKPRQD